MAPNNNRIIILLMVLFIIACDSPSGHGGISKDMAEAKKRGIFIKEYRVSSNPYHINDSLSLLVKEAWIEQRWTQGDSYNDTYPVEGYQLCINSTEKYLNTIHYPYNTIGLDGSHYLREASSDSYVGDFGYIPGDTIEYLVQTGDNLMDDSTIRKKIIGRLILIRQ